MSSSSRVGRTFVASFLVLFLEVALIRWMPAYIRLLAYFSNFILLASFLGIGVGCLLAPARARLVGWFPALVAAVVGVVYFFRLEVGIQPSGSIYFTSGTSQPVVLVESTTLLPLLFVGVAALFATIAQRMGREMAALPPLTGYLANLGGSLAGVAAFGIISWLELSPSIWFGLAFAAALPLLRSPDPGSTRTTTARRHGSPPPAARRDARARAHDGARRHLVALLQDHRRPGRHRHGRRGEQHLSPVDGAGRPQGILLPVALHGLRRHVRERARSRRRVRHRRRGGPEARCEARGRRRDRSGDHAARPRPPSGSAVLRSPRDANQRRCTPLSADDRQEIRPGRVRAHRLTDDAVELLRRAARKLHVHRGVVPRRPRPAHPKRFARRLQLLS